MAAGAFAAGSNVVDVTANVVGTCKFNSATMTLAFGALDPSLTTDANASSTTAFWCTKNTSYTISDNGGLNNSGGPRMKHATIPTEFIPYSINYNPATGSGSGKTTPITLTVSGSVLNTNYVNAAAGSYSDQVTLTINP